MSLRLRIEHGQDAGTTWRLSQPGVYTIGRQPTNSMRVLDMKVSKEHCEIRVATAGGRTQAVLVDSESTTGCQLNGQPVPKGKAVAVKPGDELRIGLTILRVLSDGEASQEARPVAGRQVDAGAVAGAGRQAGEGATKQTLPPDALVGKELSGYTIDRKIGAGGMGGVYLAEQRSLQRKVALKVLNETFAADSAFVDQFVNEARAAGALNHPNVVQVYDVGSAEGRYFFSMEIMPGGSIEDKVKEGPVAWEAGLNWFIDASNALIFAKRREILHRDVKPDNLMVAEDGSAKLCDLGLAKKSEVGDLMDQGIIGTPHFISPEAIRRKSDIDHRTDLYSLGCSFYRVFTGQNPYPGTSVKDILLGHLNKPIPRINEVNRNVPKELDEVVYQLMRKDPADRIQTPEELLRELDRIRTQYNLEAHGIKPASKKPLVIGLVAAVLAIGGAIWFVATREEPKPINVLSPDQLRAAEEARRTNAESPLKDYVFEAEKDVARLNTRYLQEDIKDPGNWKKQVFKDIAREARTKAEGWTAKLAAWAEERSGFEDEVIRSFYDKYPAVLQGHIDTAQGLAKTIDDYIAKRQLSAKEYDEGRIAALKQLEADVVKYAEKVKKLFDDEQYIDLERTLTSTELDDLVKAALAKEVGDETLLKPKDVAPILDKHIPGTKEGKERGMQRVAEAERRIGAKAGAALDAAQKALGSTPGFQEFQAALKALQDWLDTVPAVLDGEVAKQAPRITRVWLREKEKVQAAHDRIRDRRDEYEAALLEADRLAYFQFLVDLWAPRTGLLRQFQLSVARERAEKLEGLMQHGLYQRLARTWPAPLIALEQLFQDVQTAFPDNWTAKHTFIDDKNGKPRKELIKEIDAVSMKIDRDNYTFEQLGAAGLLEKLFFVEGEERLANMTPTHRLGLGMLAELAGDYQLASKQYMTAKADPKVDAETVKALDQRLKLWTAEKEVAEKYLACVRFLVRGEAYARAVEARLTEDRANPGTMTSEERSKIYQDEGPDLLKDFQSFQAMRDELQENAKFATTTWGSSIRERIHPGVAYVGEPLPSADKPRKPTKGGDGK